MQPIPLTLYAHFPWCVQKCPYCDFNSHTLKNNLPENEYIDKLISDLTQHLPQVWGRRIQSVFMGGGTPSLFSPTAIGRLLTTANALIPFNPDIEITLEANPGTVEQSRFLGYRQAGINRLSLGVQSFTDHHLKALGRIHDSQAAIQAVDAAKRAGFNNINLDLMYGLPEQSVAEALADLKQAVALAPSHLSWYQLTLEPNTWFYQHPPNLPADDLLWEIQQAGQAYLASQGYLQYEVSAYSLPGHACQHNRHYWEFGDYIGIGAGAHGKLTDFASQKVLRTVKIKHPKTYLAANDVILENKIVDKAELPFEFMLNALRLKEPIPKQLFIDRTGLSLEMIAAPLQQACERGLLQINDSELEVTALGWQFLNDLLQLFIVTND